MSAKYSVDFEVEAQAAEKKIKDQLIALGWTPPSHAQSNSNKEGYKIMSYLNKQVGGDHYKAKSDSAYRIYSVKQVRFLRGQYC